MSLQGMSSVQSQSLMFENKNVHMVQRGAKKLKIKAKLSGQSYTAISKSAFSSHETKRDAQFVKFPKA